MGGALSGLFSKEDKIEAFLSHEELEEVKIGSCLTRKEIEKLYDRFAKVDLDGSNTLDVDELLKFDQFACNPLSLRLTEIMGAGKSGVISFREFVRIMSIFSPEATPDDKYKLAFQLYDQDNDGKISKEDLIETLKVTVRIGEDGSETDLDEKGLHTVVEFTFDEMAESQEFIDFEQFKKFMAAHEKDLEIISKMTFTLTD